MKVIRDVRWSWRQRRSWRSIKGNSIAKKAGWKKPTFRPSSRERLRGLLGFFGCATFHLAGTTPKQKSKWDVEMMISNKLSS